MRDHSINESDIHNLLQKATWDTSADAKAARSLIGEMPSNIVERVDRACAFIGEAVGNDSARCLDVGCGYGVLVPHLVKAGVKRPNLHGVDLSEEMIRNARELHPDIDFQAADFIKEYRDSAGFDGIIFCAALHDFPDPLVAISKAASLLRTNGTLVVVHPQGGLHVSSQAAANPVLVNRSLPSKRELADLGANIGLEIVFEPADAGSIQDNDQGYLAVMRKV
jgi:SAM-dependent methyltransferase